eukprot:scaffold12592_cov23-Tisochrysis_lutea.AAC.2
MPATCAGYAGKIQSSSSFHKLALEIRFSRLQQGVCVTLAHSVLQAMHLRCYCEVCSPMMCALLGMQPYEVRSPMSFALKSMQQCGLISSTAARHCDYAHANADAVERCLQEGTATLKRITHPQSHSSFPFSALSAKPGAMSMTLASKHCDA